MDAHRPGILYQRIYLLLIPWEVDGTQSSNLSKVTQVRQIPCHRAFTIRPLKEGILPCLLESSITEESGVLKTKDLVAVAEGL